MRPTIYHVCGEKLGSSCDCCGKRDIRTLEVQPEAGGDRVKIGTTCFRRLFELPERFKMTAKEIEWLLKKSTMGMKARVMAKFSNATFSHYAPAGR